MIVTKSIPFFNMIKWSGHHIIWLMIVNATFATLYYYEIIEVKIPWLPLSIIGTAVAFYVGFKNNQAYDRMWEARKIWGGIVNDSRSWGMMVDGFITNHFTDKNLTEKELKAIKKRLVYRHIGWFYMHRNQLLIPAEWEHANQGGLIGKSAKYYQNKFGIGLLDDKMTLEELKRFLPKEEYESLIQSTNSATQIINAQSRDLTQLFDAGVIDDFRHLQLANLLKGFYTLQGKNERIKKFPLPRQYANISRYFIGIFIMLLPFSMIPEIMGIGSSGIFIAVPITALIGWVYVMMEIIGDYSENPFQGMANDIPMMSLCRTIEIDLLEMLGETDLPPAIQSRDGVLM
jgi:putative membrane protein